MLGIAKRIHALPSPSRILLIFAFSIFCLELWAAQDAIVITDKAMVYADKTMTSPVGYVTRGKRVTIGEVARNKSQLYPIVVSGKIAYIRATDVNTEIDGIDSNNLVAERFLRLAEKKSDNHYALSLYTYPTQVTLGNSVGNLENNDPFVFNGLQLKGAVRKGERLDLGVLLGYGEGQKQIDTFRVFETGAIVSYRIFAGKNFIFRWQNQALVIPFATYSLGSKARVNGYGLSAGTGLNANWIYNGKFGMEIYGGFHYTKLFGFDLPGATLNPSFLGTKMGVGVTYLY